MRPATLELHAYVGEPRVYRLTFTEADEVTPLVLSGEWAAQARHNPAAKNAVDIAVDTEEMAEGRLTLTIPGAEFPNRSARWVWDLEGREGWGTVLAGPLIVSPEVTRVGETTGGSVTDLVIALGPDEVRVVSSASLGPRGPAGIGVPDPSEEPDDRWLTTADGALVYTDAPSGGGGVTVHGDLDGRDDPDQHPVGAVTGLQETFVAHDDSLQVGAIVRVADLGPPVVLEHSPDPAGGGALTAGPGQYVTPDHSARDAGGGVLNRLVAVPLVLAAPLTIDRIGIETTASASGSAMRLGIYASGPGGLPGALLHDFGAVDTSATAGVLLLTVAATLPAGTVWVAAVAQGAAATHRRISAAPHNVPTSNPAGASVSIAARHNTNVSGPLPDPWVHIASAAQSFAPLVFLREAA